MQNCVITITQDNLVQSFAESTSLKELSMNTIEELQILNIWRFLYKKPLTMYIYFDFFNFFFTLLF